MMMKKLKIWCTAVLFMGFLSPAANAVLITFTPSAQTVEVGNSVSIDVSISNFAPGQFLGVYDLDLTYLASILGNATVSFGTNLFFSDQFDDTSTPGLISIFEASLESPQFLENNQASDFSLFTLEFDAMSVGVSTVMVDTIFALGDQFGIEINDVDFNSARVTVFDPNVVSEPGILALLLGGILAIGVRRKIANH